MINYKLNLKLVDRVVFAFLIVNFNCVTAFNLIKLNQYYLAFNKIIIIMYNYYYQNLKLDRKQALNKFQKALSANSR